MILQFKTIATAINGNIVLPVIKKIFKKKIVLSDANVNKLITSTSIGIGMLLTIITYLLKKKHKLFRQYLRKNFLNVNITTLITLIR